MTSEERAEKAADAWRRADGVQPLVPFIQRAIDDAVREAVADERERVAVAIGNEPAINALAFERLIRAMGDR